MKYLRCMAVDFVDCERGGLVLSSTADHNLVASRTFSLSWNSEIALQDVLFRSQMCPDMCFWGIDIGHVYLNLAAYTRERTQAQDEQEYLSLPIKHQSWCPCLKLIRYVWWA
jgi:hypothetical protein